jgi:hypothetical protein
MIYIYNAGPLFSEADIKQRKYEGAMFKKLDIIGDYFIANPIDLPLDNSATLTSVEIFNEDVKHVDLANVFFFELATGDTGTMVEFGMAIEKYRRNQNIRIYPIFSDLRLSRNQASGIECPIGFNSFVVGALTAQQIQVYDSFDCAYVAFKKELKLLGYVR